MRHFTLDGFQGFRSRFDDWRLVHELLEEIPPALGVRPAMPPFVLPYYNGVVPEDCGISGFVFLAGGHLTLHTFSFRECYFVDFLTPETFDEGRLRSLLETGFPCATTTVDGRHRAGPEPPPERAADLDNDFGPHLFLDIEGYEGPATLDALFALFDALPARIGMTPIMRPYVVAGTTADGDRVLSAMTMIAESHIALHLFPDRGRATFDLFSCRFFERAPVEAELRAALPGRRIVSSVVPRGIGYLRLRRERAAEVERARAWLPPTHS
jgi:S-adenosylmethionine/arginine decarboxylase-like enzyme